jgi:hypothetical protein
VTSARHDVAAGDAARVLWGKMAAIAGDHTAHAANERTMVVALAEERGVSMVASVEGCHRHGVQLEETNGFNHACLGVWGEAPLGKPPLPHKTKPKGGHGMCPGPPNGCHVGPGPHGSCSNAQTGPCHPESEKSH